MSLHKSRRSRNNYKKKEKLDSDNHRLHANGRMNDIRILKKIRQLKAAKALYDKDDLCIIDHKDHWREVLDPYSFTQQNAQLTRRRNYDDMLQNFDVQPPNNASQWMCVEPGNGNVIYDSDIGYESIYDDYMYNDAVLMKCW
ncbi:hypothetical protein RhiirC2_801786 [Rhizophagus irregularis]|uniref:Uncharacterized protein n=1 Tax=Rhizophagus irregularis TaxID=588596 RepID=A0A2N1M241_9GLOM|nr:hypothetical protein RhiirC2_801786 [Rhizophagus irregularis]